ncbi:tetratricopeptide repeat protein [Gallionella capsiferriformans]|jgi:predicted O-linked N-acetylglucosamine transferase (SPINDLY family)|uniref:protein O-GlcNAc transferase n=1 Tax=Gallionella capsiferriformans (strain ES-2) TaxID=395494 RepID=D9SF14_GALCS|nr:tetratricopeptide repeat protein [Gallionella capsiferriformans]ADL55111.1 Tetratricopeptide TPR_1 repeat-containing protein [Gallionella capsiferriformans ES-2]
MTAAYTEQLQSAVFHQRVGRFEDAARQYRAILQAAPYHPEANHNMGVLSVQMQQAALGLPYLIAALEADPACGQYWTSYIDALYQAGQLEEARQMLALARQQGLQGDDVEELALRLNRAVSQADAGLPAARAAHPDIDQIDALVALFNRGQLEEAEKRARAMTVDYPLHAFGWKALGAVYQQHGNIEAALVPMETAASLSPGDVEAHYNLGITYQDLGRLDEACHCYRQAVQINPHYAEAHSNLGVILQGLGDREEAEQCYRRALQIKPGYGAALSNLANLLQMLGRLDEAAACCRTILKSSPDSADVLFNLANILKRLGQLAEAEASYRVALRFNPDSVQIHGNLGITLKELGRFEEAESSFRQALRINPDYAQAHCNLGVMFKELDRLDEAERCYLTALQLAPDYADAHSNLGIVQQELGRLTDAEASFRQALQFSPDLLEAHCNLGNVLLGAARLSEAESCYRHVLLLNPDHAIAHRLLGLTLMSMGRLHEGVASFRDVVHLRPNEASAYNDLGNGLRDSGLHDQAVQCYRRALELDPRDAAVHSDLIFALDLVADLSVSAMQDERKKWCQMHAAHLRQRISYDTTPDPDRRLRIGYVSSDFSSNSAPAFFGGMLFNFDHSRFEVFTYANESRTISTPLTRRFQQSVTVWRNIFRMSDDAVADLIRADKIDILVDLSGHSGRNRLLVFARKPAPVQISAWAYATGTGMDAMDVLFSDITLIPSEERFLYAEAIRYLPAFFSYFPCQEPPAVALLPALTKKTITFGTFSRLEKVTEQTWQTWADVVLSVPDSCMLIKNAEMDHAVARARVAGYFQRAGVALDRLIFHGRTAWNDHMAVFNQVDICLDTFPQGGGVTTLEGLMMGVPVITLHSPTFVGRTGVSILTALGLVDWVAETPEQYVKIAKQKAQDIPALAQLRAQLRTRLTSSIIGNPVAYSKLVEQEYLALWQAWCLTQEKVV